MRKLVVVVFMLAGITVMAQKVDFGVKAGLNIANYSSTNQPSNLSSRLAYHVGVLAEVTVSTVFSVQPEIVFSSQGVTNSLGKDEATGKYQYLNIPLMAKYYIFKNISVEMGPQIGFLTAATITAKDAQGKEVDIDVSKALNTVDAGINFGLGYKLTNGINFAARYNLGLTNISKARSTSIKQGVIQLSLGYNF